MIHLTDYYTKKRVGIDGDFIKVILEGEKFVSIFGYNEDPIAIVEESYETVINLKRKIL